MMLKKIFICLLACFLSGFSQIASAASWENVPLPEGAIRDLTITKAASLQLHNGAVGEYWVWVKEPLHEEMRQDLIRQEKESGDYYPAWDNLSYMLRRLKLDVDESNGTVTEYTYKHMLCTNDGKILFNMSGLTFPTDKTREVKSLNNPRIKAIVTWAKAHANKPVK